MRFRRWPTRLRPLTFALALWAGLPSLEWCPLSWDDCRALCERSEQPVCAAVRASAGAPCAAAGAIVADEGICGSSAEGCAEAAGCAIPCDPVADPVPFGDRAWCVRPPLEGVPSRDIEMPSPEALPAETVEPLPQPAPPVSAALLDERAVLHPALVAHAPPLSRAPPSL
jgi:hypothetical protein